MGARESGFRRGARHPVGTKGREVIDDAKLAEWKALMDAPPTMFFDGASVALPEAIEEIKRLRAEAKSFQAAYRMKGETKRLRAALFKLRQNIEELESRRDLCNMIDEILKV